MTKVGLYAIGTPTTLESNKSQVLLTRRFVRLDEGEFKRQSEPKRGKSFL